MTLGQSLSIDIVREAVDEMVDRIKRESADPMVLVTWTDLQFTSDKNMAQTLTRAFTGNGSPWLNRERLQAATDILRATGERKPVTGLGTVLGAMLNVRKVDDGYEVRPGLAGIVSELGRMPRHDVILRVAQQGPSNGTPKITRYRPRTKSIEVVKKGEIIDTYRLGE